MGAGTFFNYGRGESAKKAFDQLRDHYLHEYGHGGYTGTIAEKDSFTRIGEVKTKAEAMSLAEKLIDDEDQRVDDKWGPAGCITITDEPNCWLFFGWASE